MWTEEDPYSYIRDSPNPDEGRSDITLPIEAENPLSIFSNLLPNGELIRRSSHGLNNGDIQFTLLILVCVCGTKCVT